MNPNIVIAQSDLAKIVGMDMYWQEISKRDYPQEIALAELNQVMNLLHPMNILLIIGEWARHYPKEVPFRVSNETTVTLPEEGTLIKYRSKYSSHVSYVRIDSFYNILESAGGGRGFHNTYLNGTGNASTPEAWVERFMVFPDLKAMQDDINAGKQHIFK